MIPKGRKSYEPYQMRIPKGHKKRVIQSRSRQEKKQTTSPDDTSKNNSKNDLLKDDAERRTRKEPHQLTVSEK
jgi:hypothetical protein